MRIDKIGKAANLIFLFVISQPFLHSESELTNLSIKLQDKGKALDFPVFGRKLDSPPIQIFPLSKDFNIDNLEKTSDDLEKLLQDPVEAVILYNRLTRDDQDKADSLFLAADDKDADPKAVVMHKDREMRAQTKELLNVDFSLQPLLLIKHAEDIYDIYMRQVGATPDGVAYSGVGFLRMKKISDKWKVLPVAASKEDPKTAVALQISDALNTDLNSIIPVQANPDE